MNKFLKTIAANGNSILITRAEVLSSNAKMAQEDIINTIKRAINAKTLEISQLTDLAPRDTTSLVPGATNWNPEVWAKKLQEAKEALYNYKIKLKLAEETYAEFFTEEAGEVKE